MGTRLVCDSFRSSIFKRGVMFCYSRAWNTYKDPESLEVVGKLGDTIESGSIAASKVEGETLLAVEEWLQHPPSKSTCITGETRKTAFVLTLCMNRTRRRHSYIHILSTSKWFVIYFSQRQSRDEDPRLGMLPHDWEQASSQRSVDDASIFERCRNLRNGELVDSNPR